MSKLFSLKTEQIGWPVYLALCCIGLTLALTWIGPRAAQGLDTLNALLFWAAHSFSAVVLLAGTQKALAQLRFVSALPALVQVLISAVLASILFTPIALFLDRVFEAEGSVDDPSLPFAFNAATEFSQFVVPLILIWTLINAPSLLSIENSRTVGAPPSKMDRAKKDEQSPISDFWSRIPGRLGREIVALSAELHYVRVYTELGETLILYPFGRAVELLEEVNGMQIHRSHWVSLPHIDEILTIKNRTICRMIGGLELPVSRSYKAGLKAARRIAVQSEGP